MLIPECDVTPKADRLIIYTSSEMLHIKCVLEMIRLSGKAQSILDRQAQRDQVSHPPCYSQALESSLLASSQGCHCPVDNLLLMEAAMAYRGCPALPLGRRAMTSPSLFINSTWAFVNTIGGDWADVAAQR